MHLEGENGFQIIVHTPSTYNVMLKYCASCFETISGRHAASNISKTQLPQYFYKWLQLLPSMGEWGPSNYTQDF